MSYLGARCDHTIYRPARVRSLFRNVVPKPFAQRIPTPRVLKPFVATPDRRSIDSLVARNERAQFLKCF